MIDSTEFQEIYQSGNYKDPHGEYAKRHDISRNEAKSRAFYQLYSASFCSSPLTTEQAAQVRGMTVAEWLQESASNVVGIQCLEIDTAKAERILSGYKNK